MSKFFAHVVFDSEDGSIGLTDSGANDALVRWQSNTQKGIPFSDIDLQGLAVMNSHHDNL